MAGAQSGPRSALTCEKSVVGRVPDRWSGYCGHVTFSPAWDDELVAETFGSARGSQAWLKMSGSEEMLDPDAPCPCGGVPPANAFSSCCGPVVENERRATTAEQLMRSRYTAYALADGHHLWATWHPRTRPDGVDPEPWIRWVGLEVLDVVDGGPGDDTGVVEFRATWVAGMGMTQQRGEIHERSRFERRAGRWFYLGPE